MSSQPVKKKNPLLALILSGLLPGLGQIYNNQIVKGLLLFAVNILITVLAYGPFQVMLSSFKSPGDLSQDMPALLMLLGYSLAGLVVLLYAMFDAFKTAGRINGGS